MRGQTRRWSIIEILVLKTISFVMSFLFIGSLAKATIYVIITTVVYYFVRRFFNYIQLRSYRNESIHTKN